MGLAWVAAAVVVVVARAELTWGATEEPGTLLLLLPLLPLLLTATATGADDGAR